MRYEEFNQQIEQMAAAASAEARCRFALDTIRLLQRSAEAAIQSELSAEETRLHSMLIAGLEAEPPDELARTLQALSESMCRDPVRATEFHPDITELHCAIENWIGYRRSSDPQWIARLAINMVNSVDYSIGGNVGDYSTNNMLGAPQMAAEFERQQRLLIAMTFQVLGRNLVLPGRPPLEFQYDVGQVANAGDVLVVLLAVPGRASMTENVFGVSRNGDILWQIEHIAWTGTDPANRYIEVMRADEATAVLYNWNGVSVAINVKTGEVLQSSLGK